MVFGVAAFVMCSTVYLQHSTLYSSCAPLSYLCKHIAMRVGFVYMYNIVTHARYLGGREWWWVQWVLRVYGVRVALGYRQCTGCCYGVGEAV